MKSFTIEEIDRIVAAACVFGDTDDIVTRAVWDYYVESTKEHRDPKKRSHNKTFDDWYYEL